MKKLKEKVKILKQELLALYYVYQDSSLSLLPKILIGLTLAYALSPIDLIPDFIPVLGYIDDLIILPILIICSIKLIPKDLMDTARIRAEREPIKLKDNKITAAIFITIWLVVAGLIIHVLLN